jgi:hypothetical protein
MTNWQSLPWELKQRILRVFCSTLIEEFIDLQLTAWDHKHFERGVYTWASEDPITPPSLRHYSSALHTCREFKEIIGTIKFTGSPVNETFQTLQHIFLKKLVEESRSDPKREKLYSNHVGLFKKVTGCFWRNPFIIRDELLLEHFLDALPFESQFTIIPYIRQWVMHHMKSRPPLGFVKVDVQPETNGKFLSLTLLKGERAFPQYNDEFYSIRGLCTDANYIAEPVEEEYFDPDDPYPCIVCHNDDFAREAEGSVEEEFPDLPLLEDIRESEPDTWWFVRRKFTDSNTEWMLVKYYEEDGQERCKIYEAEGYSAWIWTPESPWAHEGWDCDHFVDGNGSD